jgi:hypothetical protein
MLEALFREATDSGLLVNRLLPLESPHPMETSAKLRLHPVCVIPAQAGIQINQQRGWIPAFAGMTQEGCYAEVSLGRELYAQGAWDGSHA